MRGTGSWEIVKEEGFTQGGQTNGLLRLLCDRKFGVGAERPDANMLAHCTYAPT